MCPDQWALTIPLLTAIFRDTARPLRVRGTALMALTFVVPLPSAPGVEEDKAELVRRVVALLGSCLPPPPGEAVPLREAAAARLAASAGGQCDDLSARLSDELAALVAHHALMADPAIRNDVQVPCACPAGAHTRVRHLELNLYDSARRRQGFVGWWRALAECAAATMISWVLQIGRAHV